MKGKDFEEARTRNFSDWPSYPQSIYRDHMFSCNNVKVDPVLKIYNWNAL